MINPVVQNNSSRAVTSRSAPAARPIANAPMVPRVAPRPATFTPRTFNSYASRTIAQPGTNFRPNSPYLVRSISPTLATTRAEPIAQTRQPQTIRLDRVTRARELRILAAMRGPRGFVGKNSMLASINPQRQMTTRDPVIRRERETPDSPEDAARKDWYNRNDRPSYSDALRRHWHEWHGRQWWHNHCDTIVFVSGGYYFLDGSYWYPAWGYDPLQTYSDYDGPIYTYGDLLPDEVIANVQGALQDAGYYLGPITGSLDAETRAALASFQRDYGLSITGAIDEPTVQTLGLYQTSSQFVTP
ncbi:MAG: hypothetical protein DME89_06890 [Verrucomicrobia bacterium]|nr:MAG: hypothetical protein DME89_06890 [Verrucomicrobiota bacterium]